MSQPVERDRSTIVPRIKHDHFLTTLRDMDLPADDMPVTERLIADLLVTYAFDLPAAFQMVTVRDLKELSIDPATLRGLAIENVRRGNPGIGLEEQPPFLQVVTGNNLEACVLLSAKFWNNLAAQAPGEIVVAVPSRDVVLIAFSPSADELQLLRQIITDVRQVEPTHGLTAELLTWKDSAWSVYAERAG